MPWVGGGGTDLDSEVYVDFGASEPSVAVAPQISMSPPHKYVGALGGNVDPRGRVQLGMLYRIKAGDTPLEVCREALFGSREPVADPLKRRAVIELLVRIYCSPWNQALYAIPLENLKGYPREIDDYMSKYGISFDPVYQDNYHRITNGLRPTAGDGFKFALIWIPMIDVDRLDSSGVVTVEGMYHPDTEKGIGGLMIDPPREITDIGFEYVTRDRVGCDLPEGDFRRSLVAN